MNRAALVVVTILTMLTGNALAQPVGLNTGGPPVSTTFSGLPTCNSAYQGGSRVVTDSNTNTPGATIAGGGANRVTADCDAGYWKVRGSAGDGTGSTDPCFDKPAGSCVSLTDADADGLYGEDFYSAYRQLLYPGGSLTTQPVVYLAPPASQPAGGYILIEQRVRWCLSTTIPTGSNAHSCDASNQTGMPALEFVGDWSPFILSIDWNDPGYPLVWTPNASSPDAVMWFGDGYADGDTLRVNIPALRVEESLIDVLSYTPPWNAILPALCDGCEGVFNPVNHQAAPGGTSRILPVLAVGRNLSVTPNLDGPTAASFQSHALQVIGDYVTVRGNLRRISIYHGQDAEGAAYLPNTSTRTWGTGGFAYSGIYDFDAANEDVSLAYANASDVNIRRAVSGPNTGAKPVVSFFTGGGNAYPRANFYGPVISDSTVNGAVRVDAVASGNVGDAAFPPVLNFFGGLWPNPIAADQGATVNCGSATSAPAGTTGYAPGVLPARGCIYNVFGAKRAPGGKNQLVGMANHVTRFNPATAPGELYSPEETKFAVDVSSATAASGLCILDPSSRAPSIGTCDASAEVKVPQTTILTRPRVELLADAPAGSSCRVVQQVETYPGSGVFADGPLGSSDCTGANVEHPACTGVAGAVGLKNSSSGWMHPHYGEAAHPLFAAMSSDTAGEIYRVPTLVLLQPGQKYRWTFKRLRYCDASSGGRTSWECTKDSDCQPTGFSSGACVDAANACGVVNPVRVSWATVPGEREPQCYDGIDNDGDSLVDWATSGGDGGCSSRIDDSE